MSPHPGIDTAHIKEKARKDLLDLLEGVRGKKNLVIERSLAGTVGLFVKFSTLQEYGVRKVFFLENDNLDDSQRNVVFLTRGENANQPIAISEQIKRLQRRSSVEHEFTIFLIPRRTMVCDKILEDAGVLGDVSIQALPLYFVPLEQDVLSLELEDSFGDLFLRKDPTCLFLAAKALMLFQEKYGLFPRIVGKGDHAHRLMELLLRMRSEAEVDRTSGSALGMMPSANIESIVIIDRGVDFVTGLLTQLTYEGLIDEFFGVKDNQADVDISVVGPPPGQQNPPNAPPVQKGMKRKILLDSTDTLYEQLRDANFAIVGNLLNKVARRLESDFESRHVAKSTSELRDFVTKLPGYQTQQQSLKIHTGLAEEIMKHTQSEFFMRGLEIQQHLAAGGDPTIHHESIEELIARDCPLSIVLRLICLESCLFGGIRAKDLETFKRLILHAYGFQHLLTLDALERMDLLQLRTGNILALPGTHTATSRTNYTYLRKSLRLIIDEVNETNPNDIAYVYSGYAPLSVRLVQCVIQKPYLLSLTRTSAANAGSISHAAHGWQGFEDALKATKGETFNRVQKGEEAASRARQLLTGNGAPKTVLVMFLGGITRTEIAALRFLAAGDSARRILICTTGILSGGKMMDTAMEKRSFSAESGA